MSVRDPPRRKQYQEQTWVACVGDFRLLKDYLAEKDTTFWVILQLLDALLRGFGQVVFANNPISGLLIAVGIGATSPWTLVFSAATAFLGLILSVLMKDSQDNIENGLTVYNPLLIGAVSYAVVPGAYGAFDAFCYLLLLLGTIFSVYLARSLCSDKFPCITWPFNLAEFGLLFALSTQNNSSEETNALTVLPRMDNATSDATTDIASFIVQNTTNVSTNDWGMVLRGLLVSTSQVFAIDSVAAGSVIYLAILIYSPVTAGFSFLGALIGTFAGLQLGVPFEEIFSGFWGFNCLLTGASLGGNLFVLNGQTAVATIVAIVYTAVVQYAIINLFSRLELPILTIPFVVVTSLFLKLRDSSVDSAFPRPMSVSFPEKQRCDYLASRRSLLKRADDVGETSPATQDEKMTTLPIDDQRLFDEC